MKEHMHKILIVDDEENVRKSMKRCLKEIEHTIVYTAGTGDMGMSIIDNDREIEVVISDHRMPGTPGVNFLMWVRQNYPDIVSIMLTGYANIEIAKKAINEGSVFKFLTKPWDNKELVQIVRSGIDIFHRTKKARELLKNRDEEAQRIIEELEREYPGISIVKRDSAGRIIIEDVDEDFSK